MSLLSLSGHLVSRFRSSTLIVVLALTALSACDKVALLAPTGSTVTLNINKTSVAIGGTAEVVAVVVEAAGTAPQNGTMVTFSSSFGTMTPIEAPTQGGIARAIFTGTGSGTAKIGAFSGAAKATEIELKVGGAAAERVTVRTEPATIPQAGGTVTVIANVQDIGGGALPSTPVNFTVDNGSLSSNSAVTDANGEARVTLNTTRATKVSANVGTKTADFTVAVLAAPTVTLTACSASPTVGIAVTCTLTPTAAAAGSPLQAAAIEWGDGSAVQNLGPITGATSVSHTFSSPGTYTATASVFDVNGQRGTGTASLVVNRVLPTITLTVPATGTAGVPVAMSIAPPAQSATAVPIASITVDFGDGTSRIFGAITGTTGFTKIYAADGGYTVTATATDTAGQRGSSSAAIIISRALAPSVTLSKSAAGNGRVGRADAFTVTATAATAQIVNVKVTLADGTVLYNASTGGAFTWTPASNGQATITSVVTDALGNTGNHILVLTIDP